MIYIILGIGLLFFALGFIVNKSNAKYILAGYNTMSEKEREKVKLEPYLSYLKKFHVFLGISFILIGLSLHFFVNEKAAGIFISTYPILAYMYFIWNARNFSTNTNKDLPKIGLYVLGATLIFVLFMQYLGDKNDQMHIENDHIKIEGSYGQEIHYSDITKIELVNQLPKISSKIHGFAMGDIHKGIFKTTSGEKIKLVLNSDSKPFIFILTSDAKKIYFSANEDESNEDIFNEFKEKYAEFPSVIEK